MTPTLLYSGGCPVCRWLVRHVIVWLDRDRQLNIIPIRHRLALPYFHTPHASLDYLPLEKRIEHWWFIDYAGQRWAGNAGGGYRLLQHLTRTAWLGTFISWHPTLIGFTNWLDEVVKRNRPRIAPWLTDGPALVRTSNRDRWIPPEVSK